MDIKNFDKRKNPFARPWMGGNCLASAAGSTGSTPLKGLIGGAITGAIEVCFSYPTEFVKTKLQLDEKSGKKKKYSGFMDVIRKTVKEKGILGMYRGLSVLIFFSIPKVGIRFAAFEFLRDIATDSTGNLSPLNRVLCGLGAGVSEAIFAVTPMETIKVKFIHDQQKEVPQYRGLFHGISTIVKQEGFKGIYQGVTATILKQGSNQAIRFYVVETLKYHYRNGDPTVPVPKLVVGIFGIAAATASVLGNNPIDVIKTRMQGLEAKKYKGTLDCALQIWKKEGVLAFYKGTVARLIRVGLDVGFTFMFYDTLQEYFKRF